MEASSFQIGEVIRELRSRVEALERTAGASSEPLSLSELLSEYPSGATKPDRAPSETTLAPAEIIHRAPNVPLILDGEVLEDPEEITQLNGTPLHYTTLRTRTGIALAAFTDPQALITEPRKLVRKMMEGAIPAAAHTDVCTSPPDSLGERVQFYEHINESGDTFGLNPFQFYPDLTRARRGVLGLEDWNDTISSVSQCRWNVSIWEHTQFHGDHHMLRAGCNTSNLGELGWNDRASSVINWGRHF
jgi:hypothetical protein